MTELPDLSQLTHEEKDALIRALWAQVQALTVRGAELEARLGAPPKTPDNSSLPPSQGKKPNRAAKALRCGPRPGSLGRMGGGRPLAETPDGHRQLVGLGSRWRTMRAACSWLRRSGDAGDLGPNLKGLGPGGSILGGGT